MLEQTNSPSLSTNLLADIVSDLPENEKSLLEQIKTRLLGIALEVTPAPAAKQKPVKVESVADLQAAVDCPFEVRLNYQGKDFTVEGRRLRPREMAKLTEIVQSVIPPLIRGETPQKDRYNRDDPAFVKAERDASIKVRALGIYWAFAVIQKARPGLTDPKEIVDYIQDLWTEDVLIQLWKIVQDGGLRSAEYVNFT